MPTLTSIVPLTHLDLEGEHPPLTREVELPNGSLSIRTRHARVHLDALCEFAARINRKRGFLFVSRVLGRHLPVAPAVMRQGYEGLADLLPEDLPGPILFFGLAETAIALGHGVYRAYVTRNDRRDASYLHSTRYRFDRPLLFNFSEEHSHATDHFVYAPRDATLRTAITQARTLVLVDDEMTTGRTFTNILGPLRRALPSLEQVFGVVLTDWSVNRRRVGAFEARSLLRGEFTFTPRADAEAPAMPNVTSRDVFRDATLPRSDGRFGLSAPLTLSHEVRAALHAKPGERVAVVGTGEFVTAPFLVAEHLESLGATVTCQATTRSPALISHAMRCRETFEDLVGDGIPNFIYNLIPDRVDRILVCHETPSPALPATHLGHIPVDSVYL